MTGDDAVTVSDSESAPDTPETRPGKKCAIAFPQNGFCSLCVQQTRVTKAHWVRHLRRKHAKELAAAEQEALREPGQTSMDSHVIKSEKASRLFTLYAATSTFPVNHLKNKYLSAFLDKVPKFTKPTPEKLVKDMQTELEALTESLANNLRKSPYMFSIGADIATTKGMIHAFLGLTAHVWNPEKKKIDSFALDLVELEGRHTAEKISEVFDQSLEKLGIPRNRVLRIVTDCGSNMRAAFFEPLEYTTEENAEEGSRPIGWAHEFIDPSAVPDNLFGLEEEGPDDPDEEDVRSFDYVLNKHVKCAVHRLNTTLKDVFGKNNEMVTLRRRIYAVIGKFAHSHRATKLLFEKSKAVNPNKRGLKLLFPGNTRFASTAICYSRVSRLRDPLLAVCNEFEFPHISQADFVKIDSVLSIVNAFRSFMLKLQQQSAPTISLVLPGVEGLIRLLEQSKSDGRLSGVCQALIEGLKARFAEVLTSGQSGADPVYLVAACLDPVVQKRDGYLDDDFAVALASVRQIVRKMFFSRNVMYLFWAISLHLDVENEEPAISGPPNQLDSSPYGFDVPPKRARVPLGSQRDKLKNELVEYRSLLESEEVTDSLQFWSQHKQQFSILSRIAFNVLSIPGASTAVESLFSHMTKHSTAQMSSSGAGTIVRRTLMTFNEKFIEI